MSTELGAEEKQRIEEEERKRVIEEQYRAKVRADLKGSEAPRPRYRMEVLLGVSGLVVAVAIAGLIWDRKVEADRAEATRIARLPHVRYVPVSESLASSQFSLSAGGSQTVRFTISPEMKMAHVVGQFSAMGTWGADIEAFLMNEDELPNWDNRHRWKGYYSTEGPKTTDRFDVALNPGAYVLIFSNRGSLVFPRDVIPQVDLKYTRAETQ